jgi:[protein-PII] uridylyltransferase
MPRRVVGRFERLGDPRCRLRGSEFVLTPSPLTPFLELRQEVVSERLGDGGSDVCRALSDALDRGIRELAVELPTSIAIVAVGGYGRAEQCIFSDVDVLVLHGGIDPEPAVRGVLYPLWDANLKVGHAVRTLRETSTAGSEDFETLTSLLSARLLAGDEGLFEDLLGVVTGLVKGRPLASRLASLERERRQRHPYPIMAADLKDGRGALRTHQGIWWERRRAALLGLDVDDPTPEETAAKHALLGARNALHAAARRANDRFVLGLREPASAWMDMDPYDLARSVTTALDAGDKLADRRWPDIHVETDPMVRFGRRIFTGIRSRFAGDQEPPPGDAGDGSVLATAIAAVARTDGARFTADEEAMIASAPSVPWTAADRRSFELLLTAGARGRSIFGQLDELGWIDREFPEWRAVATAPQLAPFHDHPVGAHLHRTVAEMVSLMEDRGEFGEIAAEVASSEELVLAAFLHDIGKARGGDHAEIGAGLARSFLRRVGFGPATVASISDAVRLHLLLPETATRRDIGDPAVIDDFVEQVSDGQQLRILYLLAVADLRATGTAMWNAWRRALLRTVFTKALEAIEAGSAPPATHDVAAVVEAAAGSVDRRSIEEHVDAMPAGYLDTTTASDVLWHIRGASDLDGAASVLDDPDEPGRVLVVGADRAGFLLAVSRSFAANGVGVLDARLRTRSDGVAIDTFHVADDRSGAPIPADRWRSVALDLLASLSGEQDLRPAVVRRVETYHRTRDARSIAVRVGVDGRFTSIDVRMPDGLGVFTTIVEALHGEGLDIHVARIDTMGEEVRDVFLVRRVGGGGIRTAAELAALEKRILDRLRS